MNGQRLKRMRLAQGISGKLLCTRAKVDRSRLSHIERGYVSGSQGELGRLEVALAELVEAKRKLTRVAVEVGWPVSSL